MRLEKCNTNTQRYEDTKSENEYWENPGRKGRPCRFCSTREESNKTRMAFLGTGEEENNNGACSTLSGDTQSILESVKFDS